MRHPLATLLVQEHMLKEKDVPRVEDLCSRAHCTFEDGILRLGLLTPEILNVFKHHLPLLAPGELLEIDPTLLDLLPVELARRHACLPVARMGKTLVIATTDPEDVFALGEISSSTGMNIDAVPALERDLFAAIDFHYGAAERRAAAEAAATPAAVASAGGAPAGGSTSSAPAGVSLPRAASRPESPAPPPVRPAAPESAVAARAAGQVFPASSAPASSIPAGPVASAPPERASGPSRREAAVPTSPGLPPGPRQGTVPPPLRAGTAGGRAPGAHPEGSPPEEVPGSSREEIRILLDDFDESLEVPPQVRLATRLLESLLTLGATHLEVRWGRQPQGEAWLVYPGSRERLMDIPPGMAPLILQRYRVLGDMLLMSRKVPQKGAFEARAQVGEMGTPEIRKFSILINPLESGEAATISPLRGASSKTPPAAPPGCPACGEREIRPRFRYCPSCGVPLV